ncbi:MAG: AMP-binding protein, partial [Myxococcota bacterium]
MAEDNTFYPGTWAERTPDKPAIVMAGSGDVVTYAELDETANRLSRVFRAAGLQPGDHMAFCMENRAEFLPIMWGAHYAGLYYTAISSRLTAEEMAYILEDSGSRAFVTSPYKADTVAEIGDTLAGLDVRLAVGGPVEGFDDFETALAAQPSTPLPDRVESQPMLYSSGTTGRPKGVKLASDGRPLGSGEALMGLLVGLFGVTDACVYLSPAPLYHSAPLRYCTQIHRTGGTTVVLENFDAEGALAAIEKHRVTHSQWVPTMFVRMLKLPEETRRRYDVSSLEFAVHAAAPCPKGIKKQMLDWWGEIIHEYYAGTEGNGFVYCSPGDWLAHEGSVGRPINCTVHIVDDDGKEVPAGQEGAIYFEGGNTLGARFEYHNDPEK